MKIAAVTFGCKVNQYETACIVNDFLQAGYEVVDFAEPADVYLINTCTVTNRTDFKSRNALRKALSRKKQDQCIKIIATGCYAQRDPAALRKMGSVDLVIDNGHKDKILSIMQGADYLFRDIFSCNSYCEHKTSLFPDRTRAFLKIQDGCNYECAYCAVPLGRGKSRSRRKENIFAQVSDLSESGYREFVLVGVNLGLYGHDIYQNYRLAQLIADLEKIPTVDLLRLSSIEPLFWDDELISIIHHSKKVAPHFHIPLQSGSDNILFQMGRNYTSKQFCDILQKLRRIIPAAAIGLDVIAGLPGEGEPEFLQTFNLLQNLDYTYLHVFPYSPRPGTRAYSMSDKVKGDVIKIRTDKLNDLSRRKKKDYASWLLEQKPVLTGIVEKKSQGYWTMLSDHYLRTYFRSQASWQGKKVHIIPTELFLDGVKGIISD
ncbi:MAG: tRNA (N(6)-L-threonylcarbamoyladenosine(37)-C(2))-methylthiotransferase MtaB [Candidatus Cloacimonetes bacterium]|nr:tRNA (N(6)-L-threonylcarbamoyladenosine(37)-C(2))-methylthiotransferase MtaB [Candidatus Cloacimonadota bacterium]